MTPKSAARTLAVRSTDDRTWRWGVGLILGLVVIAHLRFMALDPRLPWDANLCYDQLPLVFEALRKLPSPGLGRIVRLVFTETTGGYDLLLALPMMLGAPRALVIELFGLFWVLSSLLCVALVARRVFGGPAAVMASALLASGWAVVVLGRSTWIHVPELALVLMVFCALVLDPPLRRWSSVALVALAGGGAMGIRPSGAVWMACLLPLLVYGLLRHPPRRGGWARLGAVLIGWGVGAIPTLMELWPYLHGKLQRRQAYGHVVEDVTLLRQVWNIVGVLPVILGVLGLVVLAVRFRKAVPPSARGPVLTLLAWLLLSPVLVLVFRAGLDNFPAFCVALAVLGAGGLAQLPKPLWLLPILAFLVHWTPQWLPERPKQRVQPLVRTYLQALPGLSYRVEARLDPAVVTSLLDATCPPARRERCMVVVDHGLFSPSPEEPGRLEIFLMDRPRVELLPVYVPEASRWGHEAHVFASYSCRFLESSWSARRPGWDEVGRGVRARGRMELVWERDLGRGCVYRWYTPGGKLLFPDRLPQ